MERQLHGLLVQGHRIFMLCPEDEEVTLKCVGRFGLRQKSFQQLGELKQNCT